VLIKRVIRAPPIMLAFKRHGCLVSTVEDIAQGPVPPWRVALVDRLVSGPIDLKRCLEDAARRLSGGGYTDFCSPLRGTVKNQAGRPAFKQTAGVGKKPVPFQTGIPLPMRSDTRLQELQRDLARLHKRSDPARRNGGRGREADHPGEIPVRGWKDVLWRVWQEISDQNLF
jgi:hypothetical protein